MPGQSMREPRRFALSLALGAVITISATSCGKKEPAWKAHSFSEDDLSRSNVEAELPRSLWEKITGVLTGGATAEASGGSNKVGSLPSVFAPISVYLIEKNHGILSKGNIEIKFASGGGILDLHDYVQSRSGSFYFVVDFLPKAEKVDRKVFFLSNGATRKLGNETLGAGCDTYFDISTSFAKAMSGDGFLVNTTAARHVSALAGTYFFAAAQEGKLYLASLTVKDSSQKRFQCRP